MLSNNRCLCFSIFLKTRTHSPAAHAAPHLVQMALVAPGSRLHPSWKINNSSKVALKIVTLKKMQTLQKLTKPSETYQPFHHFNQFWHHWNFKNQVSCFKFLQQKSEMSILAHTTHRSAQGSCKVPRAAEFTAWWPKSSAKVPCSTWQAAGAPNLRTESEKLLEQFALNSYDFPMVLCTRLKNIYKYRMFVSRSPVMLAPFFYITWMKTHLVNHQQNFQKTS